MNAVSHEKGLVMRPEVEAPLELGPAELWPPHAGLPGHCRPQTGCTCALPLHTQQAPPTVQTVLPAIHNYFCTFTQQSLQPRLMCSTPALQAIIELHAGQTK